MEKSTSVQDDSTEVRYNARNGKISIVFETFPGTSKNAVKDSRNIDACIEGNVDSSSEVLSESWDEDSVDAIMNGETTVLIDPETLLPTTPKKDHNPKVYKRRVRMKNIQKAIYFSKTFLIKYEYHVGLMYFTATILAHLWPFYG